MKIVIFDSDRPERSRIASLLSGRGEPGRFLIYEAGTFEEARSLFDQEHPDLILIHAERCRDSGRDLCSQVRREEGERHTGIIFIAGEDSSEGDLSVECLEMGGDDFIRADANSNEIFARVKAVLRLKAMTDELRTANHNLKILSLTDDLTGLANMRRFNQDFSDLVRNCREGKHGIAVVMADLDRFKLVNDTTNHLVGSHVLAETGRLYRQCGILSQEDIAARYGGDEFVAALAIDSLQEAVTRAERLRKAVADNDFQKDGFTVRITTSMGIAWVPTGFQGRAEDLIKAADLMLYRSKKGGRDRVSSMELKYPVDLEADVALTRRWRAYDEDDDEDEDKTAGEEAK